MKKIVFLILVTGFTVSSCMKSKTCTCTTPGTSDVYELTTKKTNSKSEMKKFEDKCKNAVLTITTTDGSGNSTQLTYTDMCVLS